MVFSVVYEKFLSLLYELNIYLFGATLTRLRLAGLMEVCNYNRNRLLIRYQITIEIKILHTSIIETVML